MLTTKENKDRFEKALKDFGDFMDSYAEIITFDPRYDEDDKTYKVVITGLDYVDAQNIVEMGMEYGKTVEWSAEGDDEDGNN